MLMMMKMMKKDFVLEVNFLSAKCLPSVKCIKFFYRFGRRHRNEPGP